MYTEAAEVTNDIDRPEPEEEYADALPSEYRMVNVLPDGPTVVEREVEAGTGWGELAEFTVENAAFDWAQELSEELVRDDLRVVYDWDVNEWLVEAEIDAEADD